MVWGKHEAFIHITHVSGLVEAIKGFWLRMAGNADEAGAAMIVAASIGSLQIDGQGHKDPSRAADMGPAQFKQVLI